MVGWAHGHGVIMDQHYRIVASVGPSDNYQGSSDMHEFRLINNGSSALVTQFVRSVHDLCAYDLCDGTGYILSSGFQEIDVATGAALFSWDSLDHISLNESGVLPSTTEVSGTGQSADSPWDYFHINSIDKNSDGNYLISARHTSTVYKISGKDGHVMWRLGGKQTDFVLEDGTHFAYQHDARWVSDSMDETVITLFNNGGNGYDQPQPHSAGEIIRLNHQEKIATLVERIDPPFIDGHAHYAKSQGNMQTLPGGGLLMGWGNDAFWTEYSPAVDGERDIVFYGYLALRNMMIYRVNKFDGWVGRPLTRPALWTYSKTGEQGMVGYVSWNGATEVTKWMLYGGNVRNGTFEKIAEADKHGFETTVSIEAFFPFTYVEALDNDGTVLRTSQVQQTFVPEEKLRPYCGDLYCNAMPTEEEREARRREAAIQEEQKRKEESKARGNRNIVIGSVIGGLAAIAALLVLVLMRKRLKKAIQTRAKREGSVGQYAAVATEEEEGTSVLKKELPAEGGKVPPDR